MLRLIAKQCVLGVVVVLTAITLTFVMVRLSGDPTSLILPQDATEPTSLSVEAGLRIALMGGVQSARVPGSPPRRTT